MATLAKVFFYVVALMTLLVSVAGLAGAARQVSELWSGGSVAMGSFLLQGLGMVLVAAAFGYIALVFWRLARR